MADDENKPFKAPPDPSTTFTAVRTAPTPTALPEASRTGTRRTAADAGLLDDSDAEGNGHVKFDSSRPSQRARLAPSDVLMSAGAVASPSHTPADTFAALPLPSGALPPGQIGSTWNVVPSAEGDDAVGAASVDVEEAGAIPQLGWAVKRQLKRELQDLLDTTPVAEQSNVGDELPDGEGSGMDEREDWDSVGKLRHANPAYRFYPKFWDDSPGRVKFDFSKTNVTSEKFTCPETQISMVNKEELKQGTIWEEMRQLELQGGMSQYRYSASLDAADFLKACMRMGRLIEPKRLSVLLGGGYRSVEYCDFLLSGIVNLLNHRHVATILGRLEKTDLNEGPEIAAADITGGEGDGIKTPAVTCDKAEESRTNSQQNPAPMDIEKQGLTPNTSQALGAAAPTGSSDGDGDEGGEGEGGADAEVGQNQEADPSSATEEDNFSQKMSYVLRNYLECLTGIDMVHFSDYERYQKGIGSKFLNSASEERKGVEGAIDSRLKWAREPMPAPAAGLLGKAVGGPTSVWRRAKDSFSEKLLSRCALIQTNRLLDWLNYVAVERVHTTGEEEFYRQRTPVVSIDPVPLLYLADAAAELALQIIRAAAFMTYSASLDGEGDDYSDDDDDGKDDDNDDDKGDHKDGKADDADRGKDVGKNCVDSNDKENECADNKCKEGGDNSDNSDEHGDHDHESEVECEQDISRVIDEATISAAAQWVFKQTGKTSTAPHLFSEAYGITVDTQYARLCPELVIRPLTDKEEVLLCGRSPIRSLAFPTDVILEMKAMLMSYRYTPRRWLYLGQKQFSYKDPSFFFSKEEKRLTNEKREVWRSKYGLQRSAISRATDSSSSKGENHVEKEGSQGSADVEVGSEFRPSDKGHGNIDGLLTGSNAGKDIEQRDEARSIEKKGIANASNEVVAELQQCDKTALTASSNQGRPSAKSVDDARPVQYSVNAELSHVAQALRGSTDGCELLPDRRIVQPRYEESVVAKCQVSGGDDAEAPAASCAAGPYEDTPNFLGQLNIAELIATRKGLAYRANQERERMQRDHGTEEAQNLLKEANSGDLEHFLDVSRHLPNVQSNGTICYHRLAWICLHALGHDVESNSLGPNEVLGYGSTVHYTNFGSLGATGNMSIQKEAVSLLSQVVDNYVRSEAELLMACAAHDDGRPWIDRADVALMTSLRKEPFRYHGL